MRLFGILILILFTTSTIAQSTLTVDVGKPGAPIQPTMWGIFFEDINFGADGGLYAELVKNRSFEFDSPLMGWKEEKTDRFSNNLGSGSTMIIHENKTHNPRYAHVTVNDEKNYSLTNEGFFGL